MNNTAQRIAGAGGLKLRCTKCGWDQFKLTAHRVGPAGMLTTREVGDIASECGRCGHTGVPGYHEAIDAPIQQQLVT